MKVLATGATGQSAGLAVPVQVRSGPRLRAGTDDAAKSGISGERGAHETPHPKDFIAWTISEFRANHGKVGGPFAGAPLLLLHTRGARTGLERVNPMMYLADGARYLVFASKAGSDRNPDWYYNLLAHPTSSIEVGDERFEVTATELHGAERDRMFASQAARYPGFAGYQRKTQRVIPVLALTPVLSQAFPQQMNSEASS